MLGAMTARQFAGWLAYYEAEPFGADRRDMQIAHAARSIIACWAKRTPSVWDMAPFVRRPPVDPKVRLANSKANVRAFLSAVNRQRAATSGEDNHRQTECDPDAQQ